MNQPSLLRHARLRSRKPRGVSPWLSARTRVRRAFAEKTIDMTHSYVRHCAHTVFATKHRLPLIPRSADEQIYNFIRQQLKNMECVPLAINGMSDHIHMLYLSNRTLSTSDILQQVKGSTSFWINKNKIVPDKFAWQNAYGSFSVSESAVEDVKRYINNQKSHHAKKHFSWNARNYSVMCCDAAT